MSDFQQFTFGEGDEGVGRKTTRWKGEAGRTARFSFLWFDGSDKGTPNLDGKPKFTGADTVFVANVGYIVVKGPEFLKLSAEPPRKRIATVVGVWPTDKNGTIDKVRLAAGECEVQVWVFAGDKYKQLLSINNEFPFGQHDIQVACTDTKFQKLVCTPCRESVFKTLSGNPKAKAIVDRILTDAATVIAGINNEVGRVMTMQQVREKIAGGDGAGAGSAALREADATVTGDIDGIVDGVLDV
jgi:hypothetical protein